MGFPSPPQTDTKLSHQLPKDTGNGERGATRSVSEPCQHCPCPAAARGCSTGGICRPQPAGGLAQTVGWGLGVKCTHTLMLPQRDIPYKHRCCHLRHSPCSHGRREDARPPRQRPVRIFFFPVLSRHARFLLLFNFLLLLHPRQDPSEARSLFPIEFLPAVGFGKHPLPPPCSPRARPAGAGTELTQLPARASAPNEPAQPR